MAGSQLVRQQCCAFCEVLLPSPAQLPIIRCCGPESGQRGCPVALHSLRFAQLADFYLLILLPKNTLLLDWLHAIARWNGSHAATALRSRHNMSIAIAISSVARPGPLSSKYGLPRTCRPRQRRGCAQTAQQTQRRRRSAQDVSPTTIQQKARRNSTS